MINNIGLKYDLANMIKLSIKNEEDCGGYYHMRGKALEASERFLHSAALLQAEEFLGWQIDTKTFSSAAFSSPGKKVTMEDIAWIFQPVARTSILTSGLMENLRTDDRKVYILSSAEGSARDVDVYEPNNYVSAEEGARQPKVDRICEMFEKMREIGAIIRIIACGTMENTNGHGMILISLPDEMTLRVRSMLSIVFPHLVVDEVDKLQEDADGIEYLPDDCFMVGMDKMLCGLMRLKVDQKSIDGIDDELDDADDELDDIAEDGEEAKPHTPIAELELSVRSYNGLMRAGIRTVEELQTLSDEELRNIRYIGIKGSEEVRQRLAEFMNENNCKNDKNGEEAGKPTPIEELDLSVRAYNCLKRSDVNTVEQLQTLSDEKLMKIRNMSRKSAEEIRQKLAEFQTTGILPKKTYMERLDELIGLTDVKEQIKRIAAFAKMKKDMSKNGNANISLALNMGFVGTPGTAKTTVARIAAGIFYEIGLLPRNELIEVGRADLVAEYIGQTAIQVKEVFRRARGKVLFIDEAYSLVDDRRGSFGDEAINTIIQEMENNRDKTIVIFAGYPDEMESFFLRNPGLKSRVPFIINFSNYSVDDMVKIAELEAKRRGFSISTEAYEKVTAICSEATLHPDMGNGRFCRNLVENAILGYASRIYGNEDGGDDDDDKNYILVGDDFTPPTAMSETNKIPIGFHA